ncbi:helix-turn-helix domain-containing protein [Sphingomonas rustica]
MAITGDRVRQRLKELGINQSELARRVGITQGTVAALISGRSRSSAHLHKIARELETTPAWLAGETSDPTSAQPDEAPLTSDERDLVAIYRALSSVDQMALLQVARAMSGPKEGRGPAQVPKHYRPDRPTLHDRKAEFRTEKVEPR